MTRPNLPALLLLAGTVALGAPSSASARPSTYQGDGSFGLGLMVGAPTGLSGKYVFDRSIVGLDFGVGVYNGFYHDATELHADVLFHPVVLARTGSFDLPFYVGAGIRLLDHDRYYYAPDRRYYYDDTYVGLRVPFGISFEFTRAPLDLFVELVPVWDFGHHDPDPYYDDRFDLTAAAGLRYYF